MATHEVPLELPHGFSWKLDVSSSPFSFVNGLLARPEIEEVPDSMTPTHYRGHDLQVWDIVDMFDLDFWEGNALKYILRWREKGGVEDLKKAVHYLNNLISRQKAREV